MKETLKLTAPVERVFRSIEGESSRVGEVTSFLKLGDGPYTRVDDSLAQLIALGPSQTLVIQTSNVIHLDWRHFVEEWVCLAKQQEVIQVVHETRGDLLGPKVPTYVWLTPGVTTVTHDYLDRETDEIKLLVNEVHEIRAAIDLLLPWAHAGFPCFIFPRVKTGHAAFFEAFLRMNPPPYIRMMLLEHEVVGID